MTVGDLVAKYIDYGKVHIMVRVHIVVGYKIISKDIDVVSISSYKTSDIEQLKNYQVAVFYAEDNALCIIIDSEEMNI